MMEETVMKKLVCILSTVALIGALVFGGVMLKKSKSKSELEL